MNSSTTDMGFLPSEDQYAFIFLPYSFNGNLENGMWVCCIGANEAALDVVPCSCRLVCIIGVSAAACRMVYSIGVSPAACRMVSLTCV